jgi:exosortase
MASEVDSKCGAGVSDFFSEVQAVWRAIPNRWLILVSIGSWVGLFHWLGNSTLGYVNTPSIFGWWHWTLTQIPDEEHAWIMPLVVLALLWCKRKEFLELEKRVFWPALFVLLMAIMLHTAGYIIQQSRLSVVAFVLGIYGLLGLFLGRSWMWLALFPFSLFVFCIPLGPGGIEIVSFPLRLLATKISALVCDVFLGISVMQNGTQLFDAGGTYQYEVAAACSGIRSLTAILAFGVIYAYLSFKTAWRRLIIAALAIPLAVLANVFRLTLIVLAAEAFGQSAGNYVHDSSVFSLLPYIPAIGGMLVFGWWLSEERRERKARAKQHPVIMAGAELKS